MSPKKDPILSTEILPSSKAGIFRAAQILNNGGLVAFPTETVYGLGADATNPVAIDRIYKAKRRPYYNPLIIHLHNYDAAKKFVKMNLQTKKLAKSFWPGPLTLILEQNTGVGVKISDRALSGLQTVAVRIPKHPTAQKILSLCNNPIAAPSANMSGKLSTTRFEDVLACMSGKIDAIVDGGPCTIGLESTIAKIEDGILSILRPGIITKEKIFSQIGKVANTKKIMEKKITSPGQLKSHYRPETPIRLDIIDPRDDELLLAFGPLPDGVRGLSLSDISDLDEAAMNLYGALADLDHLATVTKSTSIAIHPIPRQGAGIAINDRLKRAAFKSQK